MKIEQATVKHREGIHLRVAADIVKIVQRHQSKVVLSCDDCPGVDACSLMQVLMLGAPCGRSITIKAEGPDEESAARELSDFFNDGAGI